VLLSLLVLVVVAAVSVAICLLLTFTQIFVVFTYEDGANVAYHGHGTVHYSQVKFVVDELERMNETPLVIMPQKYTAPKFNINYGSKQELTERDMEVLKE
jgi:hypothetical protein